MRGRLFCLTLAAVGLGCAWSVLGLSAQTSTREPGLTSVPPPPQSLEEAARRLGELWTRAEAPLLESLLKEDGLRLQLLQEDHRSVSARKGRAALQEFFQRFPGGRAELLRVSGAGPDSARGSAEYRVVVPQPAGPLHLTLFVGFERGERGWVVAELRVLR